MSGAKRRGRPLAARARMMAMAIGVAPVLALAAAAVHVDLGPFLTPEVTLNQRMAPLIVALAAGAAVAVVLGALAARALVWRPLPRALWGLEADAEQLGALAAGRVERVTPAEREARALARQLDDLRAATRGIGTSLREMDAWARWLLPRWEALAAKRRSDGVAHLLEQLRRTRDALDAQVRGAEALAGAAGRMPVGGLDPAAEDATLVASAGRLRDSAGRVLRALGGDRGNGDADGTTSDESGTVAEAGDARMPLVRMGALYWRTAATLLGAHAAPLALVGLAWGMGVGIGAPGEVWPSAAIVVAVIVVDVLVAATLARSAARVAAPVATSLARAAAQLRAVESGERALPADGARIVSTLRASARTVRRGTAVAGGALDWPIRMGRPLFEAAAFDAAAGRHVVDIAAHEVDEAARVIVVLDQQMAYMFGEIADLVERTVASLRYGTNGEACADAVADNAEELVAVLVGGRRAETATAAEVGAVRGEDAHGEADEVALPERARLGAALSWRQRISHAMPRIRPAHQSDGRRAPHATAGAPRVATYRALAAGRGRVTVVEEAGAPSPLPGVYRDATEADLRRLGAGTGSRERGSGGRAVAGSETVIDAVEVWETPDARR